jgi:2-octaprenylphenol hydroxylase
VNHDVIIIGGGPVGSLLACVLGSAGMRVAVVEARPAAGPPAAATFELRVSALTRASECMLQAVGVWSRLTPERLGPFREMHVWDATGPGAIHFDSADIGEATLGYIAENRAVQHALEARLAEIDSVHWYRPERLEALDVEVDGVVARLSGGRLRAPLVVGADGADSRVRSLAGIGVERSDYGQRAVVAGVRTARSHDETAWQRFLPSGPLAFLPLPPPDLSSIVWSTDPGHAAHLLELPAAEFARELEDAFASRLGPVTWVGERAGFPLRGLRAARYIAQRTALVGDAAHTVHPLAGQGLNLGFLDAAALAEVLVQAYRSGRDPGGAPALRRYERWRVGHNVLMQRVLEGLKWLFASPAPPIRLARNFGLTLTDRVHPVKHLIMRHATGRAGDLPALARALRDPERACA